MQIIMIDLQLLTISGNININRFLVRRAKFAFVWLVGGREKGGVGGRIISKVGKKYVCKTLGHVNPQSIRCFGSCFYRSGAIHSDPFLLLL